LISLLLDAGAVVSAQDGLYGSALWAALEGDHEVVVKLPVASSAKLS
jgi:hypothetical protein